MELHEVADWQPEVVVTPVTSRTLDLAVGNVPSGLELWARLFPANYPAPAAIPLSETGGQYEGTFGPDLLIEPTFEGHVQVWVEETEPRREVVSDYALGGSPGHVWAREAPRGSPGHVWAREAPVISADGQVILYGPKFDFEEGEFFALQSAAVLPSVPPWTTVVGQGYRLSTIPDQPDLDHASISFGYLGAEVPPGEEGWLRVYFWESGQAACDPRPAPCWRQLQTELDLYHNTASAGAEEPGLYALMSSLEIPLAGPGWNLFAYPVEGTRPVTEALASLDGYYATVYGWDAWDPDPNNRWRVFSLDMPPELHTLHELEFGHGYWITVTENITLYLKGGVDSAMAPESVMQTPPATYYGEVLAGSGFVPTAGMTVTAWIGGNLCGQSQLLDVNGQVMYAIHVSAEGPGDWVGCGMPGRKVSFYVESQPMQPTDVWNNGQVWELALSPERRVYLPLILRNR